MELFEELHIYNQRSQLMESVLERMTTQGIMSRCHRLTWDPHCFQPSHLQSQSDMQEFRRNSRRFPMRSAPHHQAVHVFYVLVVSKLKIQ